MSEKLGVIPSVKLVSEDDFNYEVIGYDDVVELRYRDSYNEESFSFPTMYAEQIGEAIVKIARQVNEENK